ncbi:pentapeptide repeat-containing protein, partial [Rothia sp. P6271]|uniref:pentapeptide repeat-containing protein n=1 Tax=Rothia sp. P6271 TaxID=3402659 RepID=UPI003AD085CA
NYFIELGIKPLLKHLINWINNAINWMRNKLLRWKIPRILWGSIPVVLLGLSLFCILGNDKDFRFFDISTTGHFLDLVKISALSAFIAYVLIFSITQGVVNKIAYNLYNRSRSNDGSLVSVAIHSIYGCLFLCVLIIAISSHFAEWSHLRGQMITAAGTFFAGVGALVTLIFTYRIHRENKDVETIRDLNERLSNILNIRYANDNNEGKASSYFQLAGLYKDWGLLGRNSKNIESQINVQQNNILKLIFGTVSVEEDFYNPSESGSSKSSSQGNSSDPSANESGSSKPPIESNSSNPPANEPGSSKPPIESNSSNPPAKDDTYKTSKNNEVYWRPLTEVRALNSVINDIFPKKSDSKNIDHGTFDLRYVNLSGLDFSNCFFPPGSKFFQSDFKGSSLCRMELPGMELQNMNLSETNLWGANLENAKLSYTNLAYAELQEANLVCAEMRRTNLNDADLQDAKMMGANLENAAMVDADLEGAKLSGAVLRGAYLPGANLMRADLSGADLTNANLEDANLKGANLKNADLNGAKLGGTSQYLEPMQLSEAKNLECISRKRIRIQHFNIPKSDDLLDKIIQEALKIQKDIEE